MLPLPLSCCWLLLFIAVPSLLIATTTNPSGAYCCLACNSLSAVLVVALVRMAASQIVPPGGLPQKIIDIGQRIANNDAFPNNTLNLGV
jgi:hypothetical protein